MYYFHYRYCDVTPAYLIHMILGGSADLENYLMPAASRYSEHQRLEAWQWQCLPRLVLQEFFGNTREGVLYVGGTGLMHILFILPQKIHGKVIGNQNPGFLENKKNNTV